MSSVFNRLLGLLLIAITMAWPYRAHALLTIEITQGAETGIPIAVVPFGWDAKKAALPHDVAAVVDADLARSGRFLALPKKDFLAAPHHDRDVTFKDWRLLKAEALVIGNIVPAASGKVEVQFRLYDVFREKQLAGYSYTVEPAALRGLAHQIADVIYEKLTGEPGAFNTRIAYVTKETPRAGNGVYKLQVADSDGFNAQTVVQTTEPLLSPAWSPDGRQLAYVSFEHKRSKVYIQNLGDGKRDLLAEHRGINSAPAFSPDGKRLALTLSREGNPEIFVLDLATRALKRLTHNPAIDTEPAWSPDGRYLVFTSDRAGKPQIYRIGAEGGDAERLTFEGDYNARASYAPDGKMLTLVSRQEGLYHIATLRLDTRALQVLTDTSLDESPSFAPNGRLIIYATEVRGRGLLASVSADGRVRQLYRLAEGDVREPAWSPYNR